MTWKKNEEYDPPIGVYRVSFDRDIGMCDWCGNETHWLAYNVKTGEYESMCAQCISDRGGPIDLIGDLANEYWAEEIYD